MPPPDSVRVSVPKPLVAGAALFGLLLLGLLAAQVLIIEDQRSSIDRQLAINARQSARAIPLIERTRPLVDRARGALPDTRRLGRGALELTETLPPLVRQIRESRTVESLRAAGTLAATLLDNDVGDATRATRAIAAQLEHSDLARTTEYVRALSSEMLYKRRLRRTMLRTLTTLPTVKKANAVVAELVPEQTRLLRRSVAVQTETLRTNRQALALLEQTLDVARETERHAESLDRKTGGPVPAVRSLGAAPATAGTSSGSRAPRGTRARRRSRSG